jgi:hypothetical protein
MGVWMNTLSGFQANYAGGWIDEDNFVSASRRGWFDGELSTSEPVPEPTTLALLGAGLVGIALSRRRKK